MPTITVPEKVYPLIPPRLWAWANFAPGPWGIHMPPYTSYDERVRAEDALVELLRMFAPRRTRERVLARLGLKEVA
ncbi:MAG: hypothetical protein ABDH20_10625 [Thermus sp.]